MNRRRGVILFFSCLSFLLSCGAAAAQDAPVSTPPPNIVIGNYNSTAVGPFGGLEGTAYAARVSDPSAAWFNPAGLARQQTPQISGSAGVYQRTVVGLEALPDDGGSLQQLPNFVGFTFVPRQGVTIGTAILSTNAWTQETDAELVTSIPGGQHRFGYSADSGFEQRVAAVSAGYHGGGAWRTGGGLALTWIDLGTAQSVSDRTADSTSLRSLLVEADAAASSVQLRAQGGVQYDTGPWRLGAAVRSPGLTLYKSGSVMLDGVYAGDPGSLGASLFDTGAATEFHLPWEFQAGAAYVGSRLELEVDVLAYTPIDAYTVLGSDQPVIRYGDPGPGAPPVLSSSTFGGLTVAANGVVGVAAGGHYQLLAGRDLRLHAGVGWNPSPVAPHDTVFTKVDLTSWSLGLSGSLGPVVFSLGLNQQRGRSGDITLTNLVDGRVVQTPATVRMAGLIYSLAYRF